MLTKIQAKKAQNNNVTVNKITKITRDKMIQNLYLRNSLASCICIYLCTPYIVKNAKGKMNR